MADVLHKTLPDSELHEPKGVANAALGSVYKANGGGSGTWVKIDPSMLAGMGPTGQAGQAVVLDGAGGFTTQGSSAYAYGSCLTTPNGSEVNNIEVPLRPIDGFTQTLASNISLSNNFFNFAIGGLYQATFTISRYEDYSGQGGIRSILAIVGGGVVGSIANDDISSTTVTMIFRMNPSGTLNLNKPRTGLNGLPGILVQYAINRIGS